MVTGGLDLAQMVSTEDVQAIAEGRAWPIRTMETELASQFISVQIMMVAGLYGVRVKPDVMVIRECIAIMYDHYSYMGPAEIMTAYRAWGAGKTPGVEMYAGEFTPRQFGSVMAGYAPYRRKINKELAMLQGLDLEAQKKRNRDVKYRHEFAAALVKFDGELVEARNDRSFTRWSDVPNTWYNLAINRELLTWPGGEVERETGIDKAGNVTTKMVDDAERLAAKRPYWVWAQREVHRAHRIDMLDVTNGGLRSNLQSTFQRLWKGRAMIAAQRLIVFERLVYGHEFIAMAKATNLYSTPQVVNPWLFDAWVRSGIIVPERSLAKKYWAMAVAQVYQDDLPADRAARVHVRPKVRRLYGKMYAWHEVLNQK